MLPGGLCYRAVGAGPDLVYFPPFAPHHRLTRGLARTIEIALLRRIASGGFRVCSINRRIGLAPGATIADMASDYADAIRERFGKPVDVLGFSTGGAIALSFAENHGTLLRRLVVASAAHRLSPVGFEASRMAAERAEAGDVRGFQRAMAPAAARSKPLILAAAAFGSVLGPLMVGRQWDPADAVITLRADMRIDVEGRLGDIKAPTLIISGEWDPSYPPPLVAVLASRIPHARRRLYRRTGHGVILNRRFVRDVARFLHYR